MGKAWAYGVASRISWASVGVEVVYGLVQELDGLGVRGVPDLDVAPTAELAPVVDGCAPLVAGGGGLRFCGTRGLTGPRDLDYQSALHICRLGHETHKKVRHVIVAATFVDVRDGEPEPFVLHVRQHPGVGLEGLGEGLFPRVPPQAVENDMVEMGLGRRWLHDDFAGEEMDLVC